MKRKYKKLLQKRDIILLCIFLLTIGVAAGIGIRNGNKQNRSKDEKIEKVENIEKPAAIEQLDADDRKIAGVYAALYDVTEESVAELKLETGDWDAVNTRLDAAYFTIGENEKYQMAEEGYALEDLYEAESLARSTGKRALDLAYAKGKTAEGKQWSDVLDEKEKKSIVEKLGLTKAQIKELKEKKYNKDERIEIALLCFNRQETFEQVMAHLESGKTIQDLKENTR